MAQWVKPLLIGQGACSFQVWKGVFQLDWASRHAMRLNSRTGTEGLPVSSLNCDRPLHSGIRMLEAIMGTGGQITDSIRPYAPCQ